MIHVPQHLAGSGMDDRVDNSCKQRAEYLVATSSTSTQNVVSSKHQCNGAYFTEISKFPEILGN